jgi:hypothetical protein
MQRTVDSVLNLQSIAAGLKVNVTRAMSNGVGYDLVYKLYDDRLVYRELLTVDVVFIGVRVDRPLSRRENNRRSRDSENLGRPNSASADCGCVNYGRDCMANSLARLAGKFIMLFDRCTDEPFGGEKRFYPQIVLLRHRLQRIKRRLSPLRCSNSQTFTVGRTSDGKDGVLMRNRRRNQCDYFRRRNALFGEKLG